MKNSSKPIRLYNLNKTVYGEYTNITDTAYYIGYTVKTIKRALIPNINIRFLKRRFIVELISK